MRSTRIIPSFQVVAAVVAVTLLASAAQAQTHSLQPESKIWVDGVSNKSDWTVHATEISGIVTIDDSSGIPTSLRLSLPSAAIKSNTNILMDRKIHEALQVSEHPTVSFELTDASAVASAATLNTMGKLRLAGVTKDIEMNVTAEMTGDGAIRYTGSTALKMSDFNIKPPVAMLGALRTGDDVTVGFDVVFVPGD